MISLCESLLPLDSSLQKANGNGNAKLGLKTPEPAKAMSRMKDLKSGGSTRSVYDTPIASPKVNGSARADEGRGWPYLQYAFLKEDKIMDKNKRRPNHPDYDHRTLFVPKDFLDKCTPVISLSIC